METKRDFDKAARCGEPSYVWRSGQQRRLNMILQAAEERIRGRVLENGCGVGMYVDRLAPFAGKVIGLEYDLARAAEARTLNRKHPNSEIINAAGEKLPFSSNSFDLILSHEVLEHVEDDQAAAGEMARILRPGGRIALFVPNRGYPFETHGVYWRGRYHFGNIFGINYLPRTMRDRLAPHVRIYSSGDLARLFEPLPLRPVQRTIIFGAYDNIIARSPAVGRALRRLLQGLENTPFRFFGLSHFWVLEKS